MVESRVLRVVSGPEREEVTVNWRKIHNEGVHDLHPFSSNSGGQIEVDVMDGACGTYVGRAGVYMDFVRKTE